MTSLEIIAIRETNPSIISEIFQVYSFGSVCCVSVPGNGGLPPLLHTEVAELWHTAPGDGWSALFGLVLTHSRDVFCVMPSYRHEKVTGIFCEFNFYSVFK